MNKKLIFQLFVAHIFFYSCNNGLVYNEETHPDGTKKIYYTKNSGKVEGVVTEYDNLGQISKRYTMEKDEQEGIQETFWKNGNLKAITRYKNNKPNGLFIKYNNDSLNSISEIGQLKDGLKHGKFIRLYQNKIPKTHLTYIADTLKGVRLEYDSKGELIEFKHFDSHGKKIYSHIFKYKPNAFESRGNIAKIKTTKDSISGHFTVQIEMIVPPECEGHKVNIVRKNKKHKTLERKEIENTPIVQYSFIPEKEGTLLDINIQIIEKNFILERNYSLDL